MPGEPGELGAAREVVAVIFEDRRAAGRRLGRQVAALLRADRPDSAPDSAIADDVAGDFAQEEPAREDVVVVGLPRGGVPVAFEVAEALAAPLDVVVVRKLGVPFQPELAMGAVAEGGVRVIDHRAVRAARLDRDGLDALIARENLELDRRARRFRKGRPRVGLSGRTVVIVDDGIATGSTASAACRVVRALGAARVVLAAPVAPADNIGWLHNYADDVTCLVEADTFFAVGQFYADFAQTPDDEVTDLLDRAALRRLPVRSFSPESSARPGSSASFASPASQASLASTANPAGTANQASSAGSAGSSSASCFNDVRKAAEPALDQDVVVPAGSVALPGRLTVPADAREIVIFVHGSGSSRFSPRNRAVAAELNRAGLGTFLFDLLTSEEETDRANVFDVALLAGRLADVSGWLRGLPGVGSLPMAYFGASTGAAAALWASTEPDNDVASIVSRGGRPDLAAERLAAVRAPTLLVVGGEDDVVLALNNQARTAMHGETQLAVVGGATHLFSEPGTLKTVAGLARDWFLSHLPVASSGTRH